MRMPDADKATLDIRKITHYLLQADHQDNGGKAKFFAACGFDQSTIDEFKAALLAHPVNNALKTTTVIDAGRKYVVECRLATPDGSNPCIRTVWIDDGAGEPRLVTAYPVR